ncbi:L,D-transpeptidase [Ochrobactrum quorumnocens]|uniref:L,D-transpeptidase n=1 Tax=Ochrobactrum quorumnocens TaxID=271865 RepID=UPI0038547907
MTTIPLAKSVSYSAISRRSFILGLLAVQGCSTVSGTMSPSPDESPYSSEPFPVRPVNRGKFAKDLQPVTMAKKVDAPPGAIIVDPHSKHIYYVESQGTVRRYGIAVGKTGYSWRGTATIERKAKWPAWHPTDDMHAETLGLPKRIAPGPANPLGARALYLFSDGRDTLYRIHGTNEPWTIGTEASSGCIRMLNEDIIELYEKVQTGAKVQVL